MFDVRYYTESGSPGLQSIGEDIVPEARLIQTTMNVYLRNITHASSTVRCGLTNDNHSLTRRH